MDTKILHTKQGAVTTADLSHHEPHVQVVDLKSSVASSDEERLAAGVSTIRLQTKTLWSVAEKVAIFTGHAPVRGHLYIMGLFDRDPTCRFCRMEDETV
jgi:hypothetical protein